ncbi:MAG TPA: hypothetical protein IAD10_07590 [Candidatus Fimicola cottocaccae]|nr:hypothetical protein [Candidatus Fimicola cottocaccae]
MKILIVMQVYDEFSLLDNIKKYNSILNFSFMENVKADCAVFSEYNISKDILEKYIQNKVYFRVTDCIIPEIIENDIENIQNKENYDGIIILESSMSNYVAVLLGEKLKYNYVTNVVDFYRNENGMYFKRFSYNNNVYSTFEIKNKPFIVSLKMIKNSAIKNNIDIPNIIEIENKNIPDFIIDKNIIKRADIKENSDILIVAGKGVKDKKSVEKIRQFAISKKFLFGVTRPVAMNGWGKLGEIVGVSGGIYSPKICITIGVSGSAAFYVGIENSDYIISVNSNDKAPIIDMSDVSIIDDYENVIDDLFNIFKIC